MIPKNSMKLYEIDRTIEAVVERGFYIDEETGEFFDEDVLDKLKADRATKIENVLLMAKNYRSEAEAIKAEIKTLEERQKSLERKADWLVGYAEHSLAGENFSTPRVAVSYRKSESVEIAEGAVIPDEYLKIKVEPDKVPLKKALKNGLKFEGVTLAQKNNMSVK